MKKKILVVDDERGFAESVKDFLEESGEFDIRMETDGSKAISAAHEFKPDLILLDILMPGMNGLEICKALKEKEALSAIPVIMVSAKGDDTDKVTGLETGADDYMVKPLSMYELKARVHSMLRRKEPGRQARQVRFGHMAIDLDEFEVRVKGAKIDLTTTEFKILQILASRRGHVFTRDAILDYLWGDGKCVVDRTIDVHIKHLRTKLGIEGERIQNIRGVGYKLE